MIPRDNGHYHENDFYHHAPNDDYDDNSITDVISDDDKEIVATMMTDMTIIFLATAVAQK